MARKSNIKRQKAFQSIIRLFLDLPVQDYLSSSEVRCLLVSAGVSDALEKDHVTAAFLSQNATFSSARFGRSKSLYWVDSNKKENATLPDFRGQPWRMPTIRRNLFLGRDELSSIHEYLSVSIVHPSPMVNSIAPPSCAVKYVVSPSPTRKSPCSGWSGEKYNPLFWQSILDVGVKNLSMSDPLPSSFKLAAAYCNRKGADELVFERDDAIV